MLKICCNVLMMVGLFSCVFCDSEDVVLNKNETTPVRARPAHREGAAKSPARRANTMSIVRKLSEAFRYSIRQNKAVTPPQYRWLSEGPNGLSFVSSRVETSYTVKRNDTIKNERRRKLKNQFRLFHVDFNNSDFLLSSKAKRKQESETPSAVSDHDDGGHTDLVPDHILMAQILRPKSLPPLAPNAKDISLIIRKKNKITKETGYYIFENLESLLKHNKLNEFRLTPIDIHKI